MLIFFTFCDCQLVIMIVLTSDYTNLTINGRLEAKLLQNAWELLFWYTLMSRQFKIDEVWISGAYSAPIPVRYVGYISGEYLVIKFLFLKIIVRYMSYTSEIREG